MEQRYDVGHRLQPARQLLHREERAGEQEHGDHPEPEHQSEARVGLRVRRQREHRRGIGDSDEHDGDQREHAGPRRDRPEQRRDDQEDRTAEQRTKGDAADVADDDVAHAHGRREHGVVLPLPLDRTQHRPGRVADADLHRCRDKDPGRDELDVRNTAESLRVVHQRAQAVAERDEVQQRARGTR